MLRPTGHTREELEGSRDGRRADESGDEGGSTRGRDGVYQLLMERQDHQYV